MPRQDSDNHQSGDQPDLARLKSKSLSGAIVTSGSRIMLLVLNLLSTMVLARLLTPETFGLVAMVLVFTGFANLFQETGLTAATVQRKDLGNNHLSTIFWLNLLVSILLGTTIALAAPLLANIYGQPQIATIALWFGLQPILAGVGMQHSALLQRRMEFHKIAFIEVVSFATGASLAIWLAWQNPSFWPLICLPLTQAATKSLLSWSLARWIPGSTASISEVAAMIRFGANLSAFSALNYITGSLDRFLVGRFSGAEALGYYSRGLHLLQLPIGQINRPVSQVALPALSQLQNHDQDFSDYYYRAMESISAIGKPVIVFLLVCAEEIVELFLGKGWSAAVPIFQALGLGAFVGITNVASGWIYFAQARTNRQLQFELYSLPVKVLCVVVGVTWGPIGAALGVSLSRVVLYFPLRFWAFKYSPITMRGFLQSIRRATLASIFAGIVAWYAKPLVSAVLPDFGVIVFIGALGGSVYLLSYAAQPDGAHFLRSSFRKILALLPNRFQRKN